MTIAPLLAPALDLPPVMMEDTQLAHYGPAGSMLFVRPVFRTTRNERGPAGLLSHVTHLSVALLPLG